MQVESIETNHSSVGNAGKYICSQHHWNMD